MLPSGKRISDPFLALLTLGLIILIFFSVQTIKTGKESRNSVAAGLPAFPGAEGFGAKAAGGRGGRIIEVTNLNESGSGSLRAAIEASGPRIVIFKIGGVIKLTQKIVVKNPYLTVAGQTAPGKGIVLRGAPLYVGTHDVIIRGVKFRVGDDRDGEATTIRDGIAVSNSYTGQDVYNVMVDHSSISWALDENTSVWTNAHDITFQWNIISEGLDYSIHIDEGATSPGRHSMGMLTSGESKNITVHHNLFAHNQDRHPLNNSHNLDFINNVIYNWGSGATKISYNNSVFPSPYHNIIGNYYIPGSNTRGTPPKNRGIWDHSELPTGTKIYVKGNVGPNRTSDSGDEWNAVWCEGSCHKSTNPPFTPTAIYQSPAAAYNLVLANAGATHSQRDEIDSYIINDVKNKTGRIIDCVVSCDTADPIKGTPDIKSRYTWSIYSAVSSSVSDSDHDGMPNAWETARGLNPNLDDSARIGLSGYTYIEEYINSLISMPSYLVPNPTSTPVPTRTPTPTPTRISTPVPTSASVPGDANGDGRVDLLDYVIWLGHFGQTTTNGPGDGDFNRDSKVDLLDYVIWLANYS